MHIPDAVDELLLEPLEFCDPDSPDELLEVFAELLAELPEAPEGFLPLRDPCSLELLLEPLEPLSASAMSEAGKVSRALLEVLSVVVLAFAIRGIACLTAITPSATAPTAATAFTLVAMARRRDGLYGTRNAEARNAQCMHR